MPEIIWRNPQVEKPRKGIEVLVEHKLGIDRGACYGNVWRGMEAEDQLHDVTAWAELPEGSGFKKKVFVA